MEEFTVHRGPPKAHSLKPAPPEILNGRLRNGEVQVRGIVILPHEPPEQSGQRAKDAITFYELAIERMEREDVWRKSTDCGEPVVTAKAKEEWIHEVNDLWSELTHFAQQPAVGNPNPIFRIAGARIAGELDNRNGRITSATASRRKHENLIADSAQTSNQVCGANDDAIDLWKKNLGYNRDPHAPTQLPENPTAASGTRKGFRQKFILNGDSRAIAERFLSQGNGDGMVVMQRENSSI
jgi:hypothetical protein